MAEEYKQKDNSVLFDTLDRLLRAFQKKAKKRRDDAHAD